MSIERRKYLRAPISIAVVYRTDGNPPIQSFTQTLGGGGLFIETHSPFLPQTPLEVEFCLPGETQKIKIPGRVAWTRDRFEQDSPPGMGIQFTTIARSQREKIQALVLKVLKGTE
jgi:uncharacterized protein (TIGR02266 family)